MYAKTAKQKYLNFKTSNLHHIPLVKGWVEFLNILTKNTI